MYLLVVLWICLTFATPGFSVPVTDSTKIYNDLIAPLHQSLHAEDTTTTAPNATSLHKRVSIGHDWQVHFFDGPAYLPVEMATSAFAGFYLQIMSQAYEYQLSGQAPLNYFSFRRGYLTLTCSCRRAPLPWDFIHLVAQQMLEATLKGYTAQYLAKFVHAGGVEIDIDLAVGPLAVPDAHSTSGNRLRKRGWV